MKVSQLMGSAKEDSDAALLLALKPHLREERQKKVEKAVKMLTELYEYYVEYPEAMSKEYRELIVCGEKKEQAVCDYLSGMTDQYSIRKFREIYIPKAWEVY